MFEKLMEKTNLLGEKIGEGIDKVKDKAVNLKEEISTSSASVEPSDVLNVKEALKKVGEYKTPDWGMTDFTDNQMFDGIKSFQKKNNLKIDGIMKPDGETENALNGALSKIGQGASKWQIPVSMESKIEATNSKSIDWSKFPNKEKFSEYQDKVIKQKYDNANGAISKAYKKVMDNVTKKYSESDSAFGDFSRNYREMVAKNTKGYDKVYHAKANFEATQRGETGYLQSKIISDSREVADFVLKDVWKDGLKGAIKNFKEDRRANEFGRNLAVKYPSNSYEGALLKYRREKKKK
jgi:hypothetical protein